MLTGINRTVQEAVCRTRSLARLVDVSDIAALLEQGLNVRYWQS
jgi:hypothetical protein